MEFDQYKILNNNNNLFDNINSNIIINYDYKLFKGSDTGKKIPVEQVKKQIEEITKCSVQLGIMSIVAESYFFSTGTHFYEVFLIWNNWNYDVQLWRGNDKDKLLFRNEKLHVIPEELFVTISKLFSEC